MTPEEAIAILNDMKINIPVPKAAVTQRERNAALDMAISAMSCSEIPNSSDCISRQAAIDAINNIMPTKEGLYEPSEVLCKLMNLPSAQPEIIYCKDCRKHNVHFGYKEDCCALYEWRGISYEHEHDYQYCSHAERRTDERTD